jgi:phosphoglycerate kinase
MDKTLLQTIDAVDWHGKVALIRADFNVPLADNQVQDATRIERALPTIEAILQRGGIVSIMTHLGRPKGVDAAFSVRPVADRLSALLQKPVEVLADFDAAHPKTSDTVYLYENTRFFPGETRNDPALAQQMAACCDVWVMDAFATAHRAHASTMGVLSYAKEACAGYLFAEELTAISRLFDAPEKPIVAVVGGAKISGKIDLLASLLEWCDVIAIVGAMANTFHYAKGQSVGQSLYEPEQAALARSIMQRAMEKGVVIFLPQDHVVASEAMEAPVCKAISQVQETDRIYDVGPQTLQALDTLVTHAKTVIWNGPLGWFENPLYSHGSYGFAKIVAANNVYSVVGGGDTIRVLTESTGLDSVSYVSTGGGAFLALLAHRTLPIVEALSTGVAQHA